MLFLIFPQTIAAETNEDKIKEYDQKIEYLEKKDEDRQKIQEEFKNYREFLQSETSRYQQFLQNEINRKQEQLYNTFHILIGALALIFTVLGIVATLLIWGLGQSKREFKKELQEKYEAAVQELNQYKDEEMKKLKEQMKQETEKAKAQLEHELGRVEELIHAKIQKQVQEVFNDSKLHQAFKTNLYNELSLTSSRVWITGSEDEVKELERLEIPLLKKRGFKDVMVQKFDLKKIQSAVRDGKIDLLVYSCKETEKEKIQTELAPLAKFLTIRKEKIPLIVYTYRLNSRVEEKEVNDYPFIDYANFPTTLSANIFSLIYALPDQSSRG